MVLELSSWQLEAMDDQQVGPHVAVITNISPDHLDAYDTYEDYAATKRTIGHHLGKADFMVYNADDEDTRKVANETSATLLPFGLTEPENFGAWATEDALKLRLPNREFELPRPLQLSLQGEHGTRNALAAAIACLAYGAPIEAVRQELANFGGVSNRLEEIAIVDGVRYVNDSSATAPAAAIHALNVLRAQANRIHIIAGGHDKLTDLNPFADAIAAMNVEPYLLEGSATPALQAMLEARDVRYYGPYGSMQAAFAEAQAAVAGGDVLALVPACASFGMFRNEFDRGDQFRTEVMKLQETTSDHQSPLA